MIQLAKKTLSRPKHGGRINDAIKKYNLDRKHCLDLSTGINPKGWPVPLIPEKVYRDLPDNDNLLSIAANYYQQTLLQVTSGSQQSIELLPRILGKKLTIGIVSPSYAEHLYAWQTNGHQVICLAVDEIDSQLEKLDCLVIVNPNNPSAYLFKPEKLITYLNHFKQRTNKQKGYLIIDEAFMDSTPQYSMLPYINQGNIIVLRSIGKFFGLAGIRCGFIFASDHILEPLSTALMPWSVNHPARWIVRQVLEDKQWIKQNKNYLEQQTTKLYQLLSHTFPNHLIYGCSLFQTLYHPDAETIYHLLAQQGVLVRLLDNKNGLRFGLIREDAEFKQLSQVLVKQIKNSTGLE